MKVLIVEEFNHYKVLENLFHLFKDRYSITFYINKDTRKVKDLLSPSLKKARTIVNPVNGCVHFVWLLFFGHKFDKIYVSTGPEGKNYLESVNILFFYLCCVIFKEKITLNIKNLRPYLKSTPGIFSTIRSRSIKYIKSFTFETNTMREAFQKHTNLNQCFLGVVYDRYTDLLKTGTIEKKEPCKNGKIRIGLLGTINPRRRDYTLICRVLSRLTKEERAKIVIVTLGGCTGGENNEIIKQIAKYVEVNCYDGFMSAEEFDMRGIYCDLLISPLKATMEYGEFKGSGSFGDAVYLRKKIILPQNVDPANEFKDISIYYKNEEELLSIFRNIILLSKEEVDHKYYYEKFTTENVFRQLAKDIKWEL